MTVVWVAADDFITPQRSEELAAKLAVATPERLPGAGHLVREDAPESVVATLQGALA